MGFKRSGRAVLAVAAVAMVASGCSSEVVTGNPVATAPAGLEQFYGQSVRWGSCAKFSADELPRGLECAHVSVPVDYENPGGETAEIAISRLRATGDKIGSLLFNPGGPGVSGLTMNTVGDGTALAERFDRIGFDPRGVGASTPAITCLTPAEMDAERAEPPFDNDPAGIAAAEADNKDYASKCVERTGAEFLAHVGTREVVQDMDVIRAVLGDDKLSYVGYSYGTRLGYTYAEQFPDRVRALVLDGALDPSQDPVKESVLQAESFQQAFDAYAADCATEAACPLGTDPTESVKRFRELVDPLWDTPAVTDDPRGLHYGDAITGVQQTLYSNRFWPALTKGLNELREGRGDTLLALADLYDGRRDDGTYDNTADAFNAIRCVDDPRVEDRAVAAKQDAEYRRVAPFLDDGRGTGAAPLELCAIWPVPNTSTPHEVSIPNLPATVVVSTTEDPATPYQAGVDLARQLDAALITYNGTRHTVSLSGVSDCVDTPVIDYLIDLTPPTPGLTC
ncbi:alpha/beta hydrolase [Nocardia otitidiscaviarum]|uniref:Alpha/beta hydrolase n=3 Tax=Nocardia otitidiscaviarum TaxID=1823 RepID=A0A516NI01_9NOCA|nr:alpha/beta fold hydrolase [Nocardia otitidiscaviarum]QDP78534.1 alpha/beta hydrolase [Nocardia otitidiscaviarum]